MTRPQAGASPWLIVRPSVASPSVRLFCAPNAGAGALTFREWPKALPHVELAIAHLPARDGRIDEPPAERIDDVADAISDALAALPPLPTAVFGHSMGAVIAFETALRLEGRGLRVPAVIVSGRRAPRRPLRGDPIDATLPDEAFLRALDARYGGVPEAVWLDDDIRSFWLPVIRADLAMVQRYVRGPEPPLACPLWAYGGREDVQTTEADLAAWQFETRAPCAVRWFAGGHFFIDSDRSAVVRQIAADLDAALSRAPVEGRQ